MQGLISIGILPRPILHFPKHTEDTWQIVYYTHGTGTLTVGDRKIPFEPGLIVCQPPHIPHEEVSPEGYCNIHFSVRTMDNLGMEVPVFRDTPQQDILPILMQLHKEFHLRRPNWTNITEGLLNVFRQFILALHEERGHSRMVDDFIHTLILNISNHAFQPGREIQKLPISSDHFRKLFKAHTGITPVTYLTHLRIQYAVSLLRNKSLTVKEVAWMTGFSDPYYFSRIFKKVMGESPDNWRNKKGAVPNASKP